MIISERPGARRPTLDDVAAVAGVGRSTASRVVTGSPRVSAEAKRAVEDAIAVLGYVPNAAARSLVTRRTDAIAFVLSDDELMRPDDFYFGGILRGVSREVTARGRQLVIALNDDESRLESYLARQVVDGVLLLSLEAGDSRPWDMRRIGMPMVIAGRPDGWIAGACVTVDNEGGARQAVEHLMAAGCRRIAMITGGMRNLDSRARYEGYGTALRAAGRLVDPALVVEGRRLMGHGAGEEAMAELLRREESADFPIDGVFAATDGLAFDAVRALRAAGRRVPEDVRVVGFDDNPLAATFDPPLTTIAQPYEEIGRTMTRMLLEQIDSGAASMPPVVLPTELRRRASA
ncbi:LacI family DNA-binding transcriptional regulator [Pseudonocardia sp. TRM90224]|uniref:LacI family DNA-binding transcriptional regulator n=1 Tax=Pseudonocardia sp. TRM90224 TaxID=2812678 RepID=UPI001E5B4C93|nr:LacI family DNA-binding transcriptional regulator [Pseudonocardia sp. TRM90224]